ncbi:uncharacterized protein ACHE_20389A [Aspergillus chevalieri]|uniref:Uncharacterized protein n=1 Tax=Aspergillus chevalieri TaxID=182096 RepID=A0A7R7VHP6_ASPCH|nr:uncharacterized protein ACHE_20389A [Aspergillus chevalieri]BCR84931.1 hypothetical protein ACHE_20389A [Aspergillus chevalieri]
MLPPLDSFLQQHLKLREITANMQNQQPLVSPPPPYTTTRQYNLVSEDIYPDNEIDTNTDDEDIWDNTIPTPTTINIDASISIKGDNNTIIITSGSSSVPGPSMTSSPPSTSTLQAAQKHRQNRVTEMATSIIEALKESRTSGKGPIEVNISTGMKVEGSRNVISAGAGGGACRILPRAKRDGSSHDGDEAGLSLKRKRRAQSEPVENMPKMKKECSPSLRAK